MCKEYNGWSNYETWLVNLWLTNDQGTEEELRRICCDDSMEKYDKIDSLKEFVEMIIYPEQDVIQGMAADLLNAAISSVDFREIVTEHMEDDE